MRSIYISLLILLMSVGSHLPAQSICDLKYDHIWILGGPDPEVPNGRHGGVEINFNTDPVSINPNYMPVMAPFQNCSFSSAEGEFLFYSNGCEIFGADDEILPNGDSLNPGEIYTWFCPEFGYRGVQSMVVLPDPVQHDVYHVFHLDEVYSPENPLPKIVHPDHLYCTTIQVNEDFPNGKVTEKNQIVIKDTSMFAFSMTAVKHANGRDWWLIIPITWSLSYNIFLLNETGSALYHTQFMDSIDFPLAEGGQGKFSPNGSWYAMYYPKVFYNDRNILMLYKFDRNSGFLSEALDIPIPFSDFITGGLEFSPSSRFLYYNTDTSLYQLDTWADDIPATLTHIADYDGFGDPLPTRFFLMERTPDHRIIMNVTNGSQYLHVIQEPDRKGTACRFEQHAIKLPTVNNFTLPHFPNYRLGALDDPPCYTYVSTPPTPVPITEPHITLRPNPAKDLLYIDSHAPWISLQLSTAWGMPLSYHTWTGDTTLPTAGLTPGVYYVTFSFKDGSRKAMPFVKM